jgi:peptidoglycan-N-acetylglucosamine deacetylase
MTAWFPIAAGVSGAAGLLSWGAVHPASHLFGPTITRTKATDCIALTFDDGPNPAVTPRLLDLLEREHARATFFVIGRWVRACPGIVGEIAARGHGLANHTDTHANLTFLSTRRIARELLACQDAIDGAAGRRPQLMRPPFGYRGPQLRTALARSGLSYVVTWSVMGRDWTARGTRDLRNVLHRVTGGDIVVLHDGYHGSLGVDRTRTLDALAYWLPRWRDRGLRCVTLDASCCVAGAEYELLAIEHQQNSQQDHQ